MLRVVGAADPQAVACPTVTVVVPTRNRPADLRQCLESLSSVGYPSWDVVVIDQSDGDLGEAVVSQAAESLPGLRYERTRERGAARARNLGLRLARGELVAFLDDDCRVGGDWLWSVVEAFDRHPDAALVCGAVRDAVMDDELFVPAYSVQRERVLRLARTARRGHGMSAAMYVRRALAEQVGPFDVHLGPGGRFLTSEDWDYTFRVLRAGWAVVETPTIVVDHYGSRPFAGGAASRLLRNNAFGHGALHMKALRCWEPAALLMIGSELWEDVRLLRPLAPLRGGPTNAGRLVSYARGLRAGMTGRVDRARTLFTD